MENKQIKTINLKHIHTLVSKMLEQMIENFLFHVNQILYLIFIVLSVNGSYDPRNTII